MYRVASSSSSSLSSYIHVCAFNTMRIHRTYMRDTCIPCYAFEVYIDVLIFFILIHHIRRSPVGRRVVWVGFVDCCLVHHYIYSTAPHMSMHLLSLIICVVNSFGCNETHTGSAFHYNITVIHSTYTVYPSELYQHFCICIMCVYMGRPM